MKPMESAVGGGRNGTALTLFCLAGLLAAIPLVAANTTKPKPAEVPAKLIAHLPLSTRAGSEMVLQREGDKHYLYIEMASKTGFMVVNVSKPEFPALLDRQVKETDPTAGNLQMIGSDLGVASVPDRGTKGTSIRSGNSPTQTVNILDLSDPAHPKIIQSFKNVSAMIGDAGRGIIYLANDEGLWVLKHQHALLAPAKEKKPCDSYSAIAAMPPDCQ